MRRRPGPSTLDFGSFQSADQCRYNALRHLVLNGKDTNQFTIIVLRPKAVPTINLGKFCVNPHSVAVLPNAALNHIADSEHPPNFSNIHSLAAEPKRGIARYNEKRAKA